MQKTPQTDRPIVEPEFLRPPQTARLISISNRHLGELTAKGLIPVHRIGRRCIRYNRAEVIEAMKKF